MSGATLAQIVWKLVLAAGAMGGALALWRFRTRPLGALEKAPPSVRAAARRAGLALPRGADPLAAIPNAGLCTVTMALAFAQMDRSGATRTDVLTASVQRHLQLPPAITADYCTLAPWLVDQGGGAQPAFHRLTKHLKRMDHGPQFDKLMRIMGDMTATGTKGMPSAAQADAMGALAAIFRTA